MTYRLRQVPTALVKILTDPRLIVFLWPFIILLPYVLPVNRGRYATVGNDFSWLYYVYKYYLLSGLVHFRMPLWSPSEAAGFPFYSSPFTQSFYPLNILLVIFSWISREYSTVDHQRFTILGISIFALGLYFWLSELRINRRAVLFASLVMPVSFKVVEILRFPNAIHTAAWYPWILFAVTKIFKARSVKACVGYGALLAFSIICLLTGGYFYYVYYSPFLFLPYLVMLFIPYLRSSLVGTGPVHYPKVLLTLAVSGGLALALCLPYALKVGGLLQQTTDRSGNNFAYSTEYSFNFEDTLGSLVFPPAAQAEGWYFFGILGLLLILVFLLSGEKYSGVGPVEKFFFILWFAAISYITYQKESVLFWWLWYRMPGFSSLRVWGRMNIILVPIIAWLLAVAYNSFEYRLSTFKEKRETVTLGITLLFSYLAVLALQMHFSFFQIFDRYWTAIIKKLIYLQKILAGVHLDSDKPFLILGGISFAFLILIVLLRGKLFQFRFMPAALLAGLTLVSVLEIWNVGPFAWMTRWAPYRPAPLLNLSETYRESYSRERINIPDTLPLNTMNNAGILANWYYKRYVDFLAFAESEPAQRDRLLGVTQNARLYYSTSLSHGTIKSFLQDADRFTGFNQIKSYDGDHLTVDVTAPQDGYLSFIDNWDPDWKAYVDGTEQPVELLFKTFKAVRLTKGVHEVRFQYSPWNLVK